MYMSEAVDMNEPLSVGALPSAETAEPDETPDRRRVGRRTRLRHDAAAVEAELRRLRSASWPGQLGSIRDRRERRPETR